MASLWGLRASERALSCPGTIPVSASAHARGCRPAPTLGIVTVLHADGAATRLELERLLGIRPART
jgi:hypothetical protein